MSNYNNTIIYMIHKPDSDLETYVGHTTNFKERLRKHKVRFNGKDFPLCNLPLYKYMREHGKFNDYKMDIIAYYACNSKREAEEYEQYYIDLLQSKLNSNGSYASPEKIFEQNKLRCLKFKKNNYEHVCDYQKKYREKHKEKYNAILREKIKCDICGDISNRGNLWRHQKTIKCQSFNS